jgi:tRNA A-37 threonylcarbamoyl transferase component Bud32
MLLKKLKEKNLYHGKLSVNNIHISAQLDIILTDYGLINALRP